MLKLSDFFQPLNLINLLYFVFALIFFEILGTLIKSFFVRNNKIDSETHLINWLMGLGFFIFVWFIVGFFIIPTQLNLQISILILLGISLPYYLKNKKYLSLFRLVKPLILPIILILPLLPSTFVKASLPPYIWDEMAYHFVSPYVALHSISQYCQGYGDLYGYLPRLMDTLYILSFSLTRTYSVVRLVQFSILMTSIFCAFLLIKKLLGNISAVLFVLIFLSLHVAIPTLATIGYVDIAALSFLLLGLIFGITFLFSNIQDHLILSLVFWAMSIGTKYTTLTAFAAFMVSFSITYWIKNRSFATLFVRKTLLKIVLGLAIFGGYWYMKNFIVFGNPIYPFFFPCWGKFAQNCGVGSSFFGWTLQVNFYTFYSIITTLLPQNMVVRFAFVLSPFLIALFGNKKSKLLLLMLTVSFGIEIIFLKYFSGFDPRYQQYLSLTLILIMILLVSTRFKLFIASLARTVILIALVSSCILLYLQNVRNINSFNYVTLDEVSYTLGKENIYDWIKNKLPDVSAVAFWCENPPGGPIALAIFDPDVAFSYSGLMKVYLVGCYYGNPVLQPEEWKNFVLIAKERKLKFWTVSINRCSENETIAPQYPGHALETQMRDLNNTIICNSTEVVPNLYYFDFEKLK